MDHVCPYIPGKVFREFVPQTTLLSTSLKLEVLINQKTTTKDYKYRTLMYTNIYIYAKFIALFLTRLLALLYIDPPNNLILVLYWKLSQNPESQNGNYFSMAISQKNIEISLKKYKYSKNCFCEYSTVRTRNSHK